MKQDFFNFSRFRNVVAKDLRDNRKKYLLSLSMLFGVLIVFTVINCVNYADYSFADELPLFYITLFVGGAVWASVSFSYMDSRAGRIAALMTPASTFEKFAWRWIVAVPMFIVAYLITIFVADRLRVAITPDAVTEMESNPNMGFYIVGYFFIQSVFFLGSIVWRKLSVLKTFAAGLIIWGLLFGLASLMIDLFLSDMYCSTFRVSRSPVVITVIWAFTLAVYYGAYLRLKDTEIINRW